MNLDAEPEGFRLPINQSLVRDKLLLGGEPKLVILAAGICAVATASSDIRGYILAAAAWGGIVGLLVLLAKHVDPIASDTFARYTNFAAYYSAQPSIVAGAPPYHEMQ